MTVRKRASLEPIKVHSSPALFDRFTAAFAAPTDKNSLFISSLLGIFAPMPGLSSHVHRDADLGVRGAGPWSVQTPDFPYDDVRDEVLRLGKELGYPGTEGLFGRSGS